MVDVTSTTHHDHPGNPLPQQGKTTLFNMMSGNDEVGGPTHGLIKLFGENGSLALVPSISSFSRPAFHRSLALVPRYAVSGDEGERTMTC